MVTISEVEARKKRRYKRENFGGTSEGPTPDQYVKVEIHLAVLLTAFLQKQAVIGIKQTQA